MEEGCTKVKYFHITSGLSEYEKQDMHKSAKKYLDRPFKYN